MFAAYALIIGASAIAYSDNFSLACVITSVSLFLVGAADRLRTAWNWRWLQFLGAISYSLYLTHTPITNAVFRVGYMMTGRNLYLEVIWWAASIAACIAFASVMWWAIERPCVRLAQKVSFPKQNEKLGDLYPQPSIAE
jgi:peptidoglycan/LPS O-acetylase OafA/YrhL